MIEICSARNRAALDKRGHLLIGFLLAGYPAREDFLEALSLSVTAGVDIVEVGFPSLNPVNDGRILQDANRAADISILDDLAYWVRIRAAVDVPIWVMGYNEELLDVPRYRALAQAGVVDAFVLPALTSAQRIQLAMELQPYGCDVIGFVNPQTTPTEAETCFNNLPMVYMQLYVGQTGAKVEGDAFEPLLHAALLHSDVNLFAGFGIDTPERVAYLLQKGFTGTIVGTAMIKQQNKSVEALLAYIRSMKAGTNKER